MSDKGFKYHIELIESIGKVMYHGSRYSIEEGTVLTSSEVEHEDEESRVTEYILEYHRPVDSISRERCVFMVDNPDIDHIEKVGGYADYIYEVQPRSKVYRYDAGWWGEIYAHTFDWMDGSDEDRERILVNCKLLAKKYWAGRASSRPIWEYLVESAEVIELIGGYNS